MSGPDAQIIVFTAPPARRTDPERATRLTSPGFPTPPAKRDEPLLREVTGDVLRAERLAQHRTLHDVADAASISLPYLSEIERGRKEPSSEVLRSICGALHIGLREFTGRVHTRLSAGAYDSLLYAA